MIHLWPPGGSNFLMFSLNAGLVSRSIVVRGRLRKHNTTSSWGNRTGGPREKMRGGGVIAHPYFVELDVDLSYQKTSLKVGKI